MSRNPYFSVITCTYNSIAHLRECLESIDNQTYNSFEHLIIDGYSTDGTWKVLQKYATKKGRMTRLIQQKPQGLVKASNFALTQAKGKYFIFIHADDALKDKNTLKNIKEQLLLNNEPDWIYGKIELVDEHTSSLGTFPNFKLLQLASPKILKYFNYIPHQAVFIKKSVIEKFGEFSTEKNIEWVMDYDYWLRIARKTNWLFINLVISKYRKWDGSNTQSGRLTKLQYAQSQYLQDRYLNNLEKLISRILNHLIHIYVYIYKGKT